MEEARLVKPGTKEICRALINRRHQSSESKKYLYTQVEVKLDSCGSVSIGHSSLLTDIKSCKDYKVPTVILKGIGGKTEPLTKVGILKHVLPNKRTVKWLCYVFRALTTTALVKHVSYQTVQDRHQFSCR